MMLIYVQSFSATLIFRLGRVEAVCKIMKNWMVVLYWMLYSSTLHTTNSQSCDGFIMLTGRLHRNLTYGMLAICDGERWRAVCGDGWDMNEAKVLCRELGFPSDGGVSSCDDSCYGKNPSLRGATNFRCNGSETKLSECDFDKIKWWKLSLWRCRNYAGVACSVSPMAVLPSLPSAPIHELFSTTARPAPTNGSDESAGAENPAREATITNYTPKDTGLVILGVVAAILLFISVGMVIGWVWFYHKNKKERKKQIGGESRENAHTYSQSPSSVHYSTLEAQDTPTSGEREGVYHLLEGRSRAPILRKSGENAVEYSALQHN